VKGGRKSVRLTLTLWYSGALVCVLAVYAAVVLAVFRHDLWVQLDDLLHEDIEHVVTEVLAGGANPLADEDEWVEVWAGDRLLHKSPSATTRPLPSLSPPGEPRVITLRAPDGGFLRMEDTPQTIGGRQMIVRVGEEEDGVRSQLATLFWIMGLGLPITVLVAAFGGYRLARRAMAPVERSYAEMQRFTADASHELRTPLTAIRTVGEVGLREQKDDAAYREAIGSMLEEVDRLTHLIDAMLMLSRADAGRIPVSLQLGDVAELAEDVATQLGVLAEEKNQKIVVASTGRTLARIDPVILRTALVNLVDNAIRYSPPGAKIDMDVRGSDSSVQIAVRDQGRGIPAVHLQQLFERFYRVDDARSRHDGGAGLGLAIARWAVEAHDGRIDVSSEPGAGSVFRVTLPVNG
jgi:signal transduction histidine kinase